MRTTNIITAADGSRFRQEGSTRRLARRVIVIIFTTLGLIFASAAMIGLFKAATAPATSRPTPHSFALLHQAQQANPDDTCILEWNEVQHDHEVTCTPKGGTATYNDGWVDATQQLIDLYSRPSRSTTQPDGSIIDDPAGSALITECLDDATLSTSEVMACLAQ